MVNVHIHQFKPGGAVVDAAAAGWCELGREAGFAQARQVFVDPTDFFRLFRFDVSAATP